MVNSFGQAIYNQNLVYSNSVPIDSKFKNTIPFEILQDQERNFIRG